MGVGKGEQGTRPQPSEAGADGKGAARERSETWPSGRGERCGLCGDAGHAENPYNNRCDELAVQESRKFKE